MLNYSHSMRSFSERNDKATAIISMKKPGGVLIPTVRTNLFDEDIQLKNQNTNTSTTSINDNFSTRKKTTTRIRTLSEARKDKHNQSYSSLSEKDISSFNKLSNMRHDEKTKKSADETTIFEQQNIKNQGEEKFEVIYNESGNNNIKLIANNNIKNETDEEDYSKKTLKFQEKSKRKS